MKERHRWPVTLSSAAITTQLGDQGLGQQPWWVEQWMELINGYRFKKRLERAWAYAREGNVLSIRFEGRRVHARVQGSGEEPYKLKIWLDVLSDDDWRYVLEALGQKARWSAQLLAGVMPQDIERAFAASGRRLFPFKLQEVRSECTCLDNRNGKGNLCKHISAVYYLMGERFSEDPFVLFQLGGRSRAQLLSDLAEQRRLLLARKAQEAQEARAAAQAAAPGETTSALPAARCESETGLSPTPAAIRDPNRWWRYDAALDPALVVITPAMEGDTGLDAAGPLPLAEDGRFPEAARHFVDHLKIQGAAFSAGAMATAMAIGREQASQEPA